MARPFDLNELPPADDDVPVDVDHDDDLMIVCDNVSNGANQECAEADIGRSQGTTPAQPHRSSHSEQIAVNREFATQVAWVRWLLPRYIADSGRARAENRSPDRVTLPANFVRRFLRPGLASPAPGEGSSAAALPSDFSALAIGGSAGGVQQGEPSGTTTNFCAANRDGSDMNESYRPQPGNDHQIQMISRMDGRVPTVAKRIRRT